MGARISRFPNRRVIAAVTAPVIVGSVKEENPITVENTISFARRVSLVRYKHNSKLSHNCVELIPAGEGRASD
jgi:hypothetical protein